MKIEEVIVALRVAPKKKFSVKGGAESEIAGLGDDGKLCWAENGYPIVFTRELLAADFTELDTRPRYDYGTAMRMLAGAPNKSKKTRRISWLNKELWIGMNGLEQIRCATDWVSEAVMRKEDYFATDWIVEDVT